MQLKRLLLTTTSLCMLSLLPLTALGQDAGLTAAYNAYVAEMRPRGGFPAMDRLSCSSIP